jgi:hypothetical protein
MATYTVQYGVIVDGYVTVTTLTPNEIVVGASVTVANVGAAYNGTHTVYALPQYLPINVDSDGIIEYDTSYPIANAVMWADSQTAETINAITGTVAYSPTCTWIDGDDIKDWVGITVASSAAETAFLTQCAAAANAFCYRRRQEAGYIDALATSPSGDVTLGTTMYGGALYRQRGAIDQFASFSDMGTAPTTGLSPIIKQLLGISRPQVA